MKGEDEDLCICGRTLIVGDGTVFSPGFVTINPKTGLIKAVSSGTPPDQGNLYVIGISKENIHQERECKIASEGKLPCRLPL